MPAPASIAGFEIGAHGALAPIGSTVVGMNPAGSANLDITISADGRFLYSLNAASGAVGMFAIVRRRLAGEPRRARRVCRRRPASTASRRTDGTVTINPRRVARWAALPLRLIVGGGFMVHGYLKLGRGVEVFAAALAGLDIPAPRLHGLDARW